MVGGDFDRSAVIPLTIGDINILSLDSIRNALDTHYPDVVVNCAGTTDLRFCEENPREAYALNTMGALWLAAECAKRDTKLIQISTTHAGASNNYTKSKYVLEALLDAYFPEFPIVRIPWVFAKNNDKKFKTTVMEKLKSGEPIPVYDDEVGSPTYVKDVADYIIKNADTITGLITVANAGSATRREWAEEIAKILGYKEIGFMPVQRIIPMKPITAVTGNLRSWKDALRDCIA